MLEQIEEKEVLKLTNHNMALVKIKDVNKDCLPWIEALVEEQNGCIKETLWISKENEYVVYDYEPFCSGGFRIDITIEINNIAHMDFFVYLYNRTVEAMQYLNKCHDAEQMITFNLKEVKAYVGKKCGRINRGAKLLQS